MKLLVLIFLVLSSVIFSREDIMPSWILGQWVNSSTQPYVYESWKKVSTNHFVGLSYSIVNADTVIYEKMEIVNRNDSLFFATIVSDQNQGNKIEFYCLEQSIIKTTFENKNHDFPTKIIYEKHGSDSLLGKISGIKNGSLKVFKFPMKKIK
ncbi:MAG: DUF6265 family protein [Bacteroidota bacterium]